MERAVAVLDLDGRGQQVAHGLVVDLDDAHVELVVVRAVLFVKTTK